MKDIYTPPQADQPTEAQRVAAHLLANLGPARQRAIDEHTRSFAMLWRNPNATPDDILAAMGTHAASFLKSARVSVQNLIAIATITGETIDDLMPRSDWYPPRELIEHEDGTVTLAPPADGCDAWGNPILEPTPEAESNDIIQLEADL